jgi:hypothetical protein
MRAGDLSPRTGRRLFDIPLRQRVQTLGKSSILAGFYLYHLMFLPSAGSAHIPCLLTHAGPTLLSSWRRQTVQAPYRGYIHEVCHQNRLFSAYVTSINYVDTLTIICLKNRSLLYVDQLQNVKCSYVGVTIYTSRNDFHVHKNISVILPFFKSRFDITHIVFILCTHASSA